MKYYYPTKTSEAKKIDGVVALILALRRAMAAGATGGSVYETLGIEAV